MNLLTQILRLKPAQKMQSLIANKLRSKVYISLLGLCLLSSSTFNIASAKVILSPLFGDNMVLQQKSKVDLWGKSIANKDVTIYTSWNQKKFTVNADENGNWNTKVPTPKAGGSYIIT